jgi:hypothetical protein
MRRQTSPHETLRTIRLPRDAAGFVRRGCPVCSRHFKLRAHPAEDRIVQSTFASALPHANVQEIADLPVRFCVYCGHAARADAFLTPTQSHFIVTWARAIRDEILQERLRGALRRHPEGRVPWTDLPVPAALSEPNDMTAAILPCCREELKIGLGWHEEVFCHHCRAHHLPQWLGRLAPGRTG